MGIAQFSKHVWVTTFALALMLTYLHVTMFPLPLGLITPVLNGAFLLWFVSLVWLISKPKANRLAELSVSVLTAYIGGCFLFL